MPYAFSPTTYYGMNRLGGAYAAPKNMKPPTGAGSGAQGLYTQDDLFAAQSPKGYEWEPIQTAYVRTPEYIGERENRYTNTKLSNFGNVTGRLNSALSGLGAGTGSFGGDGGFGGSFTGGGSGGGTISGGSGFADIELPDFEDADNAIFARAKDKAGSLARSNVQSLNDAMAAMGMLGSGAQVEGSRKAISDSAGILGDVNREQAVTRANQSADFAKTKYQGDITQRGQNIAAQEAQARLAFEQSQAAYQRNMQLLQMIMGGMGGGGGSFGGGGYSGLVY